jgi:hypothetical protein
MGTLAAVALRLDHLIELVHQRQARQGDGHAARLFQRKVKKRLIVRGASSR